MTVLSIIWILALILTPLVYWLVNERMRSPALVGITVAVMFITSPATSAVLILAAATSWIYRTRFAPNGVAAAAACAVQLGPLVAWRIAAQLPAGIVSDLVIPLGLSFIALRGVHYAIEAYRGGLPEHRFSEMVDYFFFLPTIIAGPIHRFPAFLTDSRRRRWNPEMFSDGLERILYGYVKITLLANLLISSAAIAQIAHRTTAGSPANLYLNMFAKGFNGYLQFAGYSDIAIGFGLLLGFRIMENFDAPLIKPNVQQFWASWHMSLTSWCRDYVYTPTFSLTRARAFGILAAMAVLGLWHEFTARYLVWGLYNGAGIVLWHRWRRAAGEGLESRLKGHALGGPAWHALSVVLTVHFIFIGFVLVQQQTLGEAFAYLGTMFGVA